MNIEDTRSPRTIIRIGRQSLAFVLSASYEPFTVKSGMSIAANLRNAFRESIVLRQPNERVQVLVDAPLMLIPLEEYDEERVEALYAHTFPGQKHEAVMQHVMPDLNCVVAFSMNKDTRMVVGDHYDDVRIMPVEVPVWEHLHQRSYSGQTRKLYAYFHDGRLAVFAFGKNRFRFANTYKATEAMDAVYYITYVWQQLGMDQKRDELYYVGNFADVETLRAELKKYIQNVYAINPSADFNRAPITQEPHVEYDVVCFSLCE